MELGPDGQPLPQEARAPRRERKPMGPDANGMGPDGKPWDPERRAKMQAERAAGRPPMNDQPGGAVEAPAPTPAPDAAEAPKE